MAQAPICPFCGASWTASMCEQFDRHTVAASCACCESGLHGVQEAAVRPTEDLCCESCGKPIYRIA